MSLLSKTVNFFIGLSQKTGGTINGDKTIDEEIKTIARQIAAEGIILLKNNGALPIAIDEQIAVFGRVQNDYFYVGYGSGGDVKAPYKISLAEGLKNAGVNLDSEIFALYENFSRKNKPDEGFWGHWPLNFPEMSINDKTVKQASNRSKKALVVIGRSAGEDREQLLKPGGYYLTKQEKKILRQVTSYFDNTIVLINNGNLMDMSWVAEYGEKISAVLYAWQGGMESGNALADVITGKISPSGHLPSTIAKKYEDYPSSQNFGKKKYNNYTEDIYVGYRFFETFNKDKVLYPFGFGLSYTTFEVKGNFKIEGEDVIVEAEVKNIGKYSGKCVVQLYAETPQGKLGNPSRMLVAYAKTDEIAPSEVSVKKLRFNQKNLMTFDDEGIYTGKKGYVLDIGNYNLYLGENVRSAKLIDCFYINKLQFIEKESICPIKNQFKIIYPTANANGEYEIALKPVYASRNMIKTRVEKGIKKCIDHKSVPVHFIDVAEGKLSLDEFVSALTVSELEMLTHGDYRMNSPFGSEGNAGAFGGISKSLREKGIPAAITTDGPSGIRLNAYASLLPCGTSIASSWNENLTEKLYSLLADEMRIKGSDVLLAPGMNVHRDPLCGRNFEYFSEDPLLTGKTASAVVRGIQSRGVAACPKHFACNNQETARSYNDARVSERALREIYLKGFEICVTESDPKLLMTSYNKINGVYNCYNYDLVTTLLRNDWGYKGAVMTDWWNKPDNCPEFDGVRDNAYRIRAQIDLLMPGGDRLKGRYKNDAEEAVNGGLLSEYELRRSAKNVLKFLLECLATREKINKDSE